MTKKWVLEDGEVESWSSERTIIGGELVELRVPRWRDQGGKDLREFRRTLGLAMRDAARLVGLTPSDYSALESGSKVCRDLPELVVELSYLGESRA
jgi:DNA-binding XRE family transcriptional regulator